MKGSMDDLPQAASSWYHSRTPWPDDSLLKQTEHTYKESAQFWGNSNTGWIDGTVTDQSPVVLSVCLWRSICVS